MKRPPTTGHSPRRAMRRTAHLLTRPVVVFLALTAAAHLVSQRWHVSWWIWKGAIVLERGAIGVWWNGAGWGPSAGGLFVGRAPQDPSAPDPPRLWPKLQPDSPTGYGALTIPLLLPLTAIGGPWLLLMLHRAWANRRPDVCQHCRYDLRGLPRNPDTPLICPECGAAAPAKDHSDESADQGSTLQRRN